MDDLAALLAACRSDREDGTARAALRDRVEDDDGPTPTRDAIHHLRCESCGCPDSDEPMHMGRSGVWYTSGQVDAMNSDDGTRLFGHDYDWPTNYECPLAFYRLTRWHLVCPGCRRRLVAAKAIATRRSRRPDPADAPGSLLAGTE